METKEIFIPIALESIEPLIFPDIALNIKQAVFNRSHSAFPVDIFMIYSNTIFFIASNITIFGTRVNKHGSDNQRKHWSA